MLEILRSASYHHVTKAAIGGPNFADDQLYIELVANTRRALEHLGKNARLAVEAAHIFSRKAPYSERQDLFSDLVTVILEAGTEDAPFAYAIARRAYQNWWRDYSLHSHYYDGHLSETITNAEGEETELSELIVGEIEFERKQIDRLDAQQLWNQIPEHIQRLVIKRLQGKPLGTARKRKAGHPKSDGTLNNTERSQLNRWIKTDGHKLLIN